MLSVCPDCVLCILRHSFEHIIVFVHRNVLKNQRRNIVAVFRFKAVTGGFIPLNNLCIKRLISAALCISTRVKEINIINNPRTIGGINGNIICSASVYTLSLLADTISDFFIYIAKLLFVGYSDLSVVVAESYGIGYFPFCNRLKNF